MTASTAMAKARTNLRDHAIARTLFPETTLPRALARLPFVQADPIRAPARAQDLVLRQRVAGYLAGDLEARYPRLPIEEDFFVNYGFVSRALHEVMHPRRARTAWSAARWRVAREVQAFVRERRVVHPREVDLHFAHGKARTWFGGTSKATTQLLDGMHYRGLLRVVRRESGTRCYGAHDAGDRSPPTDPGAAIDTLIDTAVATYAPLPAVTLGLLVSAIARGAVPQ
jgi:uncharacterized protein YcaQ